MSAAIRDRIIDFRRVKASELQPHPTNKGGTRLIGEHVISSLAPRVLTTPRGRVPCVGGAQAMSDSTPQPLLPLDTPEEWRPVVGFEETYEVSNHGRIRALRTYNQHRAGRLKRPTRHPQGYLAAWLEDRGRRRQVLVHRLVATAFIGAIGDGSEINHKDGDKRNNRVSNLEIVTRSENIRHAMKTGLMRLNGEDNPAAKLTAEQVRQIRATYTSGGKGYTAFAREFGVSREVIRDIIKGRTWKGVGE